jgi:hypothetical protein
MTVIRYIGLDVHKKTLRGWCHRRTQKRCRSLPFAKARRAVTKREPSREGWVSMTDDGERRRRDTSLT